MSAQVCRVIPPSPVCKHDHTINTKARSSFNSRAHSPCTDPCLQSCSFYLTPPADLLQPASRVASSCFVLDDKACDVQVPAGRDTHKDRQRDTCPPSDCRTCRDTPGGQVTARDTFDRRRRACWCGSDCTSTKIHDVPVV